MTKHVQRLITLLILMILVQPASAQPVSQSIIQKNNNESSGAGYSVSALSDLNGDGFKDLIVGESYYDNGTGRVSIYFGSSEFNSVPDLVLYGENENDQFGFSIASGCDLNGDGFDDIAIGAYKCGTDGEGKVYIYFGRKEMTGEADLVLTGQNQNGSFGYCAASAGDLNGDGFDDLIVGTYGFSSSKSSVYIYLGGNDMDTASDIELLSESIFQYFGHSAAGVGDVNGDGYDDVVVGAYGTKSYEGRSYLYFGGNDMDNAPDVIFDGEEGNSGFGFQVSGAGDVNSDGYSDILVSAPFYNNSAGRVYVYFGGVNISAETDFVLDGEDENDYFGYSTASAGNVNGDDSGDIIIGAYSHDSFKGKAYLYYGSKSGNGFTGIDISGQGSENCFGYSVASAGDINSDGYDEVLIGATNFENEGKLYIYDFQSSVTGISDDEIVNGYSLYQNYPNPFNPVTTIKFSIPVESNVRLKVYNLTGEEIKTLAEGEMPAGIHQVEFDASNLASGIYIYKLTAGPYISVKKLMLMK